MEPLFNLSCFLDFPLAEALALLKTFIFRIALGMCPSLSLVNNALLRARVHEKVLCGHTGLGVCLPFPCAPAFVIIASPQNLRNALLPCYYGLPKDMVTFSPSPYNFCIETSAFLFVKVISRRAVSPL